MKNKEMRAAVTGGIIWGACLFVTTLAGVYFGYATPFLTAFGSIYPGYTISLTGSVVGLIYGFIDVFVGVHVAVWVYRHLPSGS